MGKFKELLIALQEAKEEAVDASLFYRHSLLLTTEFFHVEEPGMSIFFWS